MVDEWMDAMPDAMCVLVMLDMVIVLEKMFVLTSTARDST